MRQRQSIVLDASIAAVEKVLLANVLFQNL